MVDDREGIYNSGRLKKRRSQKLQSKHRGVIFSKVDGNQLQQARRGKWNTASAHYAFGVTDVCFSPRGTVGKSCKFHIQKIYVWLFVLLLVGVVVKLGFFSCLRHGQDNCHVVAQIRLMGFTPSGLYFNSLTVGSDMTRRQPSKRQPGYFAWLPLLSGHNTSS